MNFDEHFRHKLEIMLNNSKISKLCALLLSLVLLGYYASSTFEGLGEQQLLSNVEDARAVRGGRNTIRGRRLQSLVNTVLNSMISLATPRLSEKILYIVNKYFRSYDFGWTSQPQHMGDKAFMKRSTAVQRQMLPSICNASAGEVNTYVKYDYNIMMTYLSGIDSISINKVALAQGTQDIDLIRSGFRYKAEWHGDWVIDTAFSNLTVHTISTVTATVQDPTCGARRQATASVNGTFFLDDVEGVAIATVFGTTERIFSFLATSELSSADIRSMKFYYEPFNKATIGSFNLTALDNSAPSMALRNLDDLTAVRPWGDAIEPHFKYYGEVMFTTAAQHELDVILPRPFIYDPED